MTQHILHEDTLKWTKLNYYMLINGLLLTAFSASAIPMRSVIQGLISIVGLFAAFVWEAIFTRAIVGGKARIRRAITIEKELTIEGQQILCTYGIYPDEADRTKQRKSKTFHLFDPDRNDLFNRKAATMLRIIPLLFIFLWTCLLVLSVIYRF